MHAHDPYYEAVAAGERRRGKLTRAQRDRLPASAFAIPERRAYPIPDAEHARYALQYLTRVAGRWGTRGYEETAERVLDAVRRRYPAVFNRYPDLVDEIEDEYGLRRVAAAAEDRTESSGDPEFDAWMRKLDKYTEARIGLSIHDLEDMMFHDAYDAGTSPADFYHQEVVALLEQNYGPAASW